MTYLFIGLSIVGIVVAALVYMGNKQEVFRRNKRGSSTSYIEAFNILMLVLNLIGGMYLAYSLSVTVTITDNFEVVSEINYITLVVSVMVLIACSFFIFALIKAFVELKEDTKEIIDQNNYIIEKLEE